MIGKIWLEQRDMGIEVWRWYCHFDDRSGYRSDWGSSKRMVRDACAVAMSGGGSERKIVFKRTLDS